MADACCSRGLLASLLPFIVATFEATRMMPPATLDGLPLMSHSLVVARILCARGVHGRSQYRRASSTGSGWRLLNIILGALEARATAAAGGSGAQGAWRSTSWCHRGCGCCSPAARRPCCSASVVAYWSAPAASGWTWTVLELVGRLGRLETDERRVRRCRKRVLAKVTTCGPPRGGPRPRRPLRSCCCVEAVAARVCS